LFHQGYRNSTGRINSPGPLEFSEAEPPTKEQTQAGPRHPCTSVADVQLVLHVSSEQLEWGRSQKLYLGYVFLDGLPCLASVGEDVPSFTETNVPGLGYTQEEPTSLKKKGRWGKIVGVGDWERGSEQVPKK